MRLKKRCDESEAKTKALKVKIEAIMQSLEEYKAVQNNRANATSTALQLTGVMSLQSDLCPVAYHYRLKPYQVLQSVTPAINPKA